MWKGTIYEVGRKKKRVDIQILPVGSPRYVKRKGIGIAKAQYHTLYLKQKNKDWKKL